MKEKYTEELGFKDCEALEECQKVNETTVNKRVR